MNNCSFIGRVGRDAECRYTNGGDAVAGWSLAVDSGYGKNKSTLWIDCSLWGKRAETLAQYIRKGAQLGVQGELGKREHEGKTYLTLRVADVTLLGKGEGRGEGNHATPAPNDAPADDLDDDLPF